ncbi:MAG: TlpA disulfide reductase family protein [Elusimicrobiota bacterium]
MADLTLPSLSGKSETALARCAAKKCLTVVVAPWCGVCRTKAELIKRLGAIVKARGVETRVVVGMDTEEAVREFAREFGPDTLLDPAGRLRVAGVPHFLVSDSSGVIVNKAAGMPGPVRTAEALAWYLALD